MTVPSDRFYHARISERKDFAADLWMIRIDPGPEFKFKAGQFATLGVETPGKILQRPYSIVSSPYEPQIEIFIELVPQGSLTPLLYKLPAGGEVIMRRVAKGRFTLDTQSGHTHHLLLATVTGVAPYVSYVRTLARDWKAGTFDGNHKLFLLHGASRSWEFGYREELERFAAELPWFRYVPTVSRPWEDLSWRGETGRVDDLIRKYADQWECSPASTTAYLCGHPQMIEQGEGILQRRGFAKESVRIEMYWVPEKKAAS